MSASRDILTRPAPGPGHTLRYGPAAEHVIDGWRPAGTPRALVVMVHGGFWRVEYDRRYTYSACAAWAAAGYAVASVEYRRTGGVGGGLPGTFEDVAAAVDLLCARAEAPVVLAGHSAGGHLAVWASLRHLLPAGSPGRLAAPPAIAGVLSLSGVLDLGAALDADLDRGAARALLGEGSAAGLAWTDPVRIAAAAGPLGGDGGPGARTIALHGDADPLVPIAQSRAYARASGAVLRVLPGVGHFEPVDPRSGVWPEVERAAASIVDAAG